MCADAGPSSAEPRRPRAARTQCHQVDEQHDAEGVDRRADHQDEDPRPGHLRRERGGAGDEGRERQEPAEARGGGCPRGRHRRFRKRGQAEHRDTDADVQSRAGEDRAPHADDRHQHESRAGHAQDGAKEVQRVEPLGRDPAAAERCQVIGEYGEGRAHHDRRSDEDRAGDHEADERERREREMEPAPEPAVERLHEPERERHEERCHADADLETGVQLLAVPERGRA